MSIVWQQYNKTDKMKQQNILKRGDMEKKTETVA